VELVHLVGFITKKGYDARSHERKKSQTNIYFENMNRRGQFGHAAGYMRRTSMLRYKDVGNRLEDCMSGTQGKVQRQTFMTIVKNSMKFASSVTVNFSIRNLLHD
jgi:hypothetical protein